MTAPDPTTTATSGTGAALDPTDGQPVFADGMSRRRWLDMHADERRAAVKAAILADPDGPEGG